jgi:hypothetical protein
MGRGLAPRWSEIFNVKGGTNMLSDARWQRHLFATLHLEPLFKSEHQGRRPLSGHPWMQRSTRREADNNQRLLSLLDRLGVGPEVAEASLERNDATVARAAAIIAEWMTYLPQDCVKTMVSDGWHWST